MASPVPDSNDKGGQVLPTKQLAGLFSRASLFTLISHGSHAREPCFLCAQPADFSRIGKNRQIPKE